MKLTALEIKQQKFDRSIRGFDVNEVNAFLNVMATEWEHMSAKNREMTSTIERLNEKLQHYERVESALHETLQTAKDSATQRLENAKKDARSKIEKAEMEAENILREARQQRQHIRQSIMRLLDRREEIIRGMRSYLDMANESLGGFTRDESALFTLPREEEEGFASDNSNHKRSAKKKAADISLKKRAELNTTVPGIDDVDDIIDELE